MFNHETNIPFESISLNQKEISLKKGTIIQLQGDKLLKFYKVKKGLLRSYILDEKGKEHTYMFAPEDWVIGDVYAFSKNIPTELFIDVIEDSDVIVFNAYKMDENTTLKLEEYKNEFGRLVNRVGVLQERVLRLLSATALTRYKHFVKTYPQILNRVPQKMIATYLGITPEALSKVRSEWVKAK